jgi:MFS family permease
MNRKTAMLNLIICSMMHGLNHYLMIFFKPTYPSMAEYFGIENLGDITSRMTIIYVSYAISNFISGVLSRRYSLKLILFFGMLLMSISTILASFVAADSYSTMVLLVIMMGFGGGTYHPAANTLITSCYEGRPGHAIGMISIGAAVGFSLAPFIGEYIGLKWLGFQKLFLFSGLISLAFSLFFLMAVKDPELTGNQLPNNSQTNSIPPLPMGKILIIGVALMCIPVTVREILGWSFYEITPWWVDYGFSSGITIGWVQAMQYMPGIIVQPLTGKLCDRFNPKNIAIITFSLMASGVILFATSLQVVAWIGLVMFGIGACSSIVASETYMATIATAKDRSIVYGVTLSIGLGVGGFLAGFSGRVVDIFGKNVGTGYRIWFMGIGTMLILSTGSYIIIKQMRKLFLSQ